MQASMARKLGASAALAVLIVVGVAIAIRYLHEDGSPGAPGSTDTAATADPSLTRPGDTDGAGTTVAAGDDAAASEVVAEEATPPADTPARLEGVVRDSEDRPIAGAEVIAFAAGRWRDVLEGAQSEFRDFAPKRIARRFRERFTELAGSVPRTRSGPEGAYAFHEIPPGEYKLHASHPGHLPDFSAWALVSEDATANADVTLARGYLIAGRALDVEGRPVAGALVRATPAGEGTQRGMASVFRFMSSLLDGSLAFAPEPMRTARDGSFAFAGLEPEAHDVVVNANGFLPGEAMKVRPGTEDVSITLERGAHVAARIVDASGAPIAGADWAVSPSFDVDVDRNPLAMMQLEIDFEGERTMTARSDGEGHIRAYGLKPGRYVARVMKAGRSPARREFDLDGDAKDLGEITLDDPHRIAGVVTDPAGAPLGGATVWIANPHARSNNPFQTEEDRYLARTETGADGRFMLEPLPAGTYSVQAKAPDFAETTVEEIAANSDEVEIRLDRGLVAYGRVVAVTSGEPIPGVRVVSFASPAEGSIETDDAGEFVIQGIADSQAMDLRGTKGMYVRLAHEAFSTEHAQIRLESAFPEKPQEFRLQKGQRIRGITVNEEDEPIAGARVEFRVPGLPDLYLMVGPGSPARAVYTDREGAFTVSVPGAFGVPGQTQVELVVSHPAFAAASVRTADLGTEDVEDLKVILGRGSGFEGTVRDEAGQPVPGARVRVSQTIELPGELAFFREMMPSQPLRTAYTRSDGTYRCFGLSPGSYTVEVVAMDFAPTKVEGLVVGEGPLQRDFVLGQGGVLAGTVLDSGGAPVRGAEIVLFADGAFPKEEERNNAELVLMRQIAGTGEASARSDADGAFRIVGLAGSKYALVARREGFAPIHVPDVRPGSGPVEIVLERLSAVIGVVRSAGTGAPVTEYRLQLESLPEEGEASTQSAFGGAFPNTEQVSDAEGRFKRELVPPGRYMLAVHAKEFAPSEKRITVEEASLEEHTVLLERGYSVRVIARDAETGEPVAGATVNCQRQEGSDVGRTRFYEQHATGADGVCVVGGLAPGKYSVHVYHALYFNEDGALREFETTDGEQPTFEFELRRGATLRGRLTGLRLANNGQEWVQLILEGVPERPTPGARGVEEETSDSGNKPDPQRMHSIWVNPGDGTFSASNLQPGEYTVYVQRSRRVTDGAPQPPERTELERVKLAVGEETVLERPAP